LPIPSHYAKTYDDLCFVRIVDLKQEEGGIVFKCFEGMKKVKEESKPKDSKNTIRKQF